MASFEQIYHTSHLSIVLLFTFASNAPETLPYRLEADVRANAVRSEDVKDVPLNKPMADPFWRDAVQEEASRQQGLADFLHSLAHDAGIYQDVGVFARPKLFSTGLPARQRNHVGSYQCPRCRSLFRKEQQFSPHFQKALAEIGISIMDELRQSFPARAGGPGVSYSSKEATLSTVNPVSRIIALRVPLAISL